MSVTAARPERGLRGLDPAVRRTFLCQWAYSVLGGINAGILTNAPTVGHKALGAASWHLALPTGLTGLGLLLSLALGLRMGRRPKMPFVLAPGALACAAGLGMAAAPGPLGFLFLLGVCNLFETATRPAVTAIIRANYPVEVRGRVTGVLRQWSAGAFILATYLTALALDRHGTWPVIRALVVAAAAVQACAYAAFALIRVRDDRGACGGAAGADPPSPSASRDGLAALGRDRRFAVYLAGCFVHGVGALLYDPVVRPYFATDLGMNYTRCAVLVDVLPSVVSVLTVRRLGAWFDRTNPLVAWAVIRVGWGLDPLLLALAAAFPAGSTALAVAGRTARGSVMNGSWILGWQIGTNYFAGRRDLTSVYMGAYLTVVGVQRMLGPPLGAFLAGSMPRRNVLALGGLIVLASAALAWRQAQSEKVDGRDPTFADRERVDLGTGSSPH
jgi:MFS family permease